LKALIKNALSVATLLYCQLVSELAGGQLSGSSWIQPYSSAPV